MTDFRYVIYLGEDAGDRKTAEEFVRPLDEWLLRRTNVARWRFANDETFTDADITPASLVVLKYSDNSARTEAAFERIRSCRPDAPLIILRELRSTSREEADSAIELGYPGACFLYRSDLQDIKGADQALGRFVYLFPAPSLKLSKAEQRPDIRLLIKRFGEDRFKLTIDKYFPDEEDPDIHPVDAGWSGAPLCRLAANNKEYYLKFFDKRDKFVREIDEHDKAREWLGDREDPETNATVGIRRLKELGTSGEEQARAFPDEGPGKRPFYAICYESASAGGRDTLKKVYAEREHDVVRKALCKLLRVLARQTTPLKRSKTAPWSLEPGRLFFCDKMKAAIIRSFADLDSYGPSAFGTDWDHIKGRLELLVYKPDLPGWLTEGKPVALGHTHGDPNLRNCLINPEAPEDLRLIDCGGYKPDGCLVDDLAIIERDLKFILLATDKPAGLFLDLDPHHFNEWRVAEHEAVDARPWFSGLTSVKNQVSVSTQDAYTLVGRVRSAAMSVCCLSATEKADGKTDEDKDGRHYFAALLYWTLDILKEPAVRRTKKLLALYSASEILRRFQ